MEHFRTDHLLQNLGRHAVSSGIVTVASQGTRFVLNLAGTVVLARLLSPAEFGLVGMVLAVTGLLGLFRDAGLSTVTVQREAISQDQVSNLFWINLALGGLVGLFVMGLAPVAAWFFRDARLVGIMLALSLTFPLTGAAVQHQALLIRQMRFRAKAVIEVTSMAVSMVTACGMAWYGLGYWSLIGMQLCLAVTTLILTWWLCGWRPTLPKRNTGVAPLLKFGAHLTVSDLVARGAQASDTILIGRFFGPEPLGLYSRANALMTRPLDQLLTPVGSILIPALSRLQSDPERYRRTFLWAYDMLAMVTFPLMALFLALSEPLVLFLLGPGWEGAVPLFAGFTLVALSLPLAYAASWLLLSQGRGQDLFQTYLVLSFLTLAAFIAGLPWGPLGVVLAFAVVNLLVRVPILYHSAGRRGPVSAADLWKGFFSFLPCWGAVYAAAALGRTAVAEAAPLMQLVVCGLLGLAAAAGSIFVLKRPRQSALYAWNKVRDLLVRQAAERHRATPSG